MHANSKYIYFQATMNGSNEKAITGKIMIDFEYFIQLAILKEIPWKFLAFMMTDLATTLDISKQIIRALVQELEKWVLKVENNCLARSNIALFLLYL